MATPAQGRIQRRPAASWPPGWRGGSSWRLLAAQLLRCPLATRAQQPAVPVNVEEQNVAGALY